MVDDRPEDTGPPGRNRAGPSARRRRSIWKPPRSPAIPRNAAAGAEPRTQTRTSAASGPRHRLMFPVITAAFAGAGDRRAGDRRGLVPGMERGFAATRSTGRHRRDRWPGRAYRQRRVQNQCAASTCASPGARCGGGRADRDAGEIVRFAARANLPPRARSRRSSPPSSMRSNRRRASRRAPAGSVCDQRTPGAARTHHARAGLRDRAGQAGAGERKAGG